MTPEFERRLTELEHTLYGNGREGLRSDVTEMRGNLFRAIQDIQELKKSLANIPFIVDGLDREQAELEATVNTLKDTLVERRENQAMTRKERYAMIAALGTAVVTQVGTIAVVLVTWWLR